jgi:hypothetical protein
VEEIHENADAKPPKGIVPLWRLFAFLSLFGIDFESLGGKYGCY